MIERAVCEGAFRDAVATLRDKGLAEPIVRQIEKGQPFLGICLGLQMLFGFVYAATMAINGEITVGMYIAYVGLVVWLIWPIRNLGRIIVNASSGMVSYGRLMEVVKQSREPLFDGKVQRNGPAKGEIVFEDVSFMY